MILESKERIEEYTLKGYWREETLLDDFKRNARWYPDRFALIDPPNKESLVGLKPERINYQELDRVVDAVATAFVEIGIEKDDVIIMQLPNTWELAMLYLAIARAGATPSPLPMQWRQREFEYIARLTGAKAFITLKEFRGFKHLEMGKELQPRLPGLKYLLSLEELKELSKGGIAKEKLDKIPTDPNDIFWLEWTSGTEAEPKGCPMSHNNWYAQSNLFLELYECRIGDVILCPAPLVNMTSATMYIPWIRTAGTFVLHHPFEAEICVQQLIEEKVNRTILVPAMLVMTLKHPRVDEFDFSSLRTVVTGSAPPSLFALQEFKRRWGIEILNNWGQNEGTNLISGPVTTPLEERVKNFPQFGKKGAKWPCEAFFRGIETKVVEPDSKKELTEPGQVGELLYRSPSVIPCYFKQPEMTKAAFEPDGFFHTGDLFRVEENNYVSFFDRKKDIIIRGGFNISAQEIENLLLAYPKVQDVAAVAMPDPTLGEKVCVYVVPRGEEKVTLEDLVGFLKTQGVAVYKLPERLEIVQAIPRNPIGKILKIDLRKDIEKKLSSGQA